METRYKQALDLFVTFLFFQHATVHVERVSHIPSSHMYVMLSHKGTLQKDEVKHFERMTLYIWNYFEATPVYITYQES